MSDIKSNLWKFHLFQLTWYVSFFLPVIVLFWQNIGLSMTQIMLSQSVFAIAVVVLEIPTGYFADVYGRKASLITAAVLHLVGFGIYCFAGNFYLVLAAEIILGFAVSFLSGADTALVYDTLKDMKQEQMFKKVWGHMIFVYMVAIGISQVVGGFIGKANLRWTFFVGIPFYTVGLLVALSIKEPRRHKLIITKGYFHKLLEILLFCIKNEKMRWLLVYSAIIFSFNQVSLWMYQPYMVISGLDVLYFGVVFASFQIVAAVSSKYAHALEEKLGSRFSLIMLVVLLAGSYFLMSNFIFLFSFSFAFIQQFVRAFHKVVITDYINKLVSSDIRATVLSAQSMVGKLLYAIIIPVIGWIVDAFSLLQALAVMGVTTVTAGAIILFILHKDKVL